MEEPFAELERQLLSAYVASAGYDLRDLQSRHDETARRVLADASMYASQKLSEVEARVYFLQHLHGRV
jgi:hypothetical protein